MPGSKNLAVLAGMPLVLAGVANAAVQMRDFVPVDELPGPGSRLSEIFEPMSRKPRPVLGRSECRFCKSFVVSHPWPGVRGVAVYDVAPIQ